MVAGNNDYYLDLPSEEEVRIRGDSAKWLEVIKEGTELFPKQEYFVGKDRKSVV